MYKQLEICRLDLIIVGSLPNRNYNATSYQKMNFVNTLLPHDQTSVARIKRNKKT